MRGPVNLKPLGLVLLATLACAAGYAAYWYTGTQATRQALAKSRPELEWLRREYQLSPAQYDQVVKLDQEYAPRCQELCARVSASQEKLAALAVQDQVPGPAMEAAVTECARVEADCRKHMLEHLHEVAQQMAPDQRERFLGQMTRRLLHPTPLDQVTGTSTHAAAGHQHE